MTSFKSIDRRQLLAAIGSASVLPAAMAQAGVTKLILPVSAGSGVDGIVRAASNQLGRALGGTAVVENQPGAGGVVGTAALVKSAPDGGVDLDALKAALGPRSH